LTVDVSMEVLIGASLFIGGQLVTLASVVRSNRDQGRRIGAVEKWQVKHDAKKEGAETERRRNRTSPLGHRTEPEDETP
jgi:hypothetical protein